MGNIAVLKNGNFYMNDAFYHGSMAIDNGIIQEIAAFNEIKNKYPIEKVHDLEGQTVFPGFIDSHIHLVQTGFLQIHLDLSTIKSIGELKNAIRSQAERVQPGEWIIGSAFDDNLMISDRLPNKHDLDMVAPHNPVFIIRVCTHLMVANSKALELAKINKNTVDPQGGKIDRDPDGAPTGVLRRNAGDLIYAIIYSDSNMIKKAITAALRHLKKHGITTAHSMAIGVKRPKHYFNVMNAYQEALKEEGYPVRVKLGAEFEVLDSLLHNNINFLDGDHYFCQGYIKFFTDGSYGSRTALLRQPYTDDPNHYGIEAAPKEKLQTYTKKAHKNGYQCAIHALGDKALSNALDILAKITERNRNPLRHRIVHAGICPPSLIDRIKDQNVSIDIQPNFVASEVTWLEKVLGSRIKNVYTWHSMQKSGINLAASSDSPVEPVNPFYGIRSAIKRQNLEKWPPNGLNPEEKVNLHTAIDMYTKHGAYQYFEETVKGTIAPNKFADLVVLSQNPFSVETDELINIKVEMTFVGGRLVFKRH